MNKNIIFGLVLMLTSSIALAEWVKVARSPVAVSYMDPSTIRKSGSKTKVWIVIDHKVPQPYIDEKKYLSMKMQTEFDCAEETSKNRSMTMYSGNMGEGEIMWTGVPSTPWEPVMPGTINWDMLKKLCK